MDQMESMLAKLQTEEDKAREEEEESRTVASVTETISLGGLSGYVLM